MADSIGKAQNTPAASDIAPQIGDRMDDGTVFAGISPVTNKPMYALPEDAPLSMRWKEAMQYAADYEGHGHPKGTFRAPAQEELNLLFSNRVAIGGFREKGVLAVLWYWSSTRNRPGADYAYNLRFDAGLRDWHHINNGASLRLVRS